MIKHSLLLPRHCCGCAWLLLMLSLLPHFAAGCYREAAAIDLGVCAASGDGVATAAAGAAHAASVTRGVGGGAFRLFRVPKSEDSKQYCEAATEKIVLSLTDFDFGFFNFLQRLHRQN